VEYKLFQPKKYAEDDGDTEWKADLEEKVLAIRALEQAGAEGRAELELYLGEVV